MNKQIASGNLVAAATIGALPNSDRQVLNFTIACNEGKDSKGNEIVEFIPVAVYGKKGFADKVVEYLGKGAAVEAVGRLVKTKNAKDDAVYFNPRVETNSLRDIQLLGGRTTPATNAGDHEAPAEAREAAAQAANNSKTNPMPDYDSFDDDIPF